MRQKLARDLPHAASDLTTLYLDNFAVFSRSGWRSSGRPHEGGSRRTLAYGRVRGEFYAPSDAHTLLNRLLYVDTKTYLHELLMKQDQMSMAASIESRVPFLDHELVEFAARMPERMKVRG